MKNLLSMIFLPITLAGVLTTYGCSDPSSGPTRRVLENYYHERPAWSPDGAKIAFTIQSTAAAGVYLVDSSGSNLVRIKTGEGIGITWSPDSRWLAFSAGGSLYQVRTTGDSLSLIGFGVAGIRPAWSPNGAEMAYSNLGLWLFSFLDSSTTKLLSYGNFASWTAAGTDIFYLVSSSSGIDYFQYEFRSYNLASKQEQTLSTFPSGSDCGFSSINLAGDAIVYSRRPFSGVGYAQVWKLDMGGAHRQLTVDAGDYPSWSPDGSKIVFSKPTPDEGGLWIMNADGSGQRRLTGPYPL